MSKNYKYLILGSNGLLGKCLKKSIKKKLRICVARKKSDFNCDLTNKKKISLLFNKYNFKYVINCAAYTDVTLCQKKNNFIKKINVNLPKYLTKLSISKNFKLVHISSDSVYFAKKNILNKEVDKTRGLNNYSKSKLIAETFVKKNKKNLIIRTNFTGFKKKISSTFIGWAILSLKKRIKFNLFNDFYTSTLDVDSLSKYLIKLINKKSNGVYNIGSKDTISKKKFILNLANNLNLPINYVETSCRMLSTKRSNYLGLNCSKVEKKLNCKMISSKQVILNLIKQGKQLKII